MHFTSLLLGTLAALVVAHPTEVAPRDDAAAESDQTYYPPGGQGGGGSGFAGGQGGGFGGGNGGGGGGGGGFPGQGVAPCAGLPGVPQCCEANVLGVIATTCHAPIYGASDRYSFQQGCLQEGQTAQCCVLPLLGSAGLLCNSPFS